MNDQDLINLQKLVGPAPQPSLLDPPTPEHQLLAQALLDYGGPLAPRPAPTPYQLALADALEAYGKQGPQSAGYGADPAGVSDLVYRPLAPGDASGGYPGDSSAANQQVVSYSYPASQGAAPGGSATAADSGMQIAMGSPANVDLPWQTMADQYTEAQPKPAPATASPPAPSKAPAKIGEIKDFPETGKDSWRADNDQVFIDAVNRYNTANGYRPGDAGYWTARMLKAQAMVESGGNKAVFQTDPLQVNTRRTWDPDHKPQVTGLTSRDQVMTPTISADAALKWLQYKGWHHNDSGKADHYWGDDEALQRYRGSNSPDPTAPGMTIQQSYAARIRRLAAGQS